MALHKHDQFTAEDQEVAALAKALGHPARIAILRLLAARQSCICGDIVQELPLSQSTVSQHLKELKAVGLVRGDIDGPRVCYCLDAVGWAKTRALFADLFDQTQTSVEFQNQAGAPGCAC